LQISFVCKSTRCILLQSVALIGGNMEFNVVLEVWTFGQESKLKNFT
jgi:hypothetical protein